MLFIISDSLFLVVVISLIDQTDAGKLPPNQRLRDLFTHTKWLKDVKR